MSAPVLSKHNDLIALDSGVWVKADESDRAFIDYTDGDSIEERVFAQVEAASDRSVFSKTLDQPWDEWALEYHLGSKRSNIYRGLNLAGVKTVLEVGCGCGAITRFLGEQGFRVDAIEGSLRRAQIARLRTSDLDNVQIISSNYHQLVLGENSYDLVVFTGVLEYSGAYAPKGVSPEEQLNLTLIQAKAALSQRGQVLIAIENRTGFKYLAGATEDHLSVASIGLLDYPEPKSKAITRGIRTWSKKQWRKMIEDLGFDAYQFCYPFPDYKVPDVILSDHFLSTAAHPAQVLGRISSRDYLKRWQPQLSEAQFWRTAAQTGTMDEFSNSFLIILGASNEQIEKTIDFDFVRFAGLEKALPYRVQISKLKHSNKVQRSPLSAGTEPGDGQLLELGPIVDGAYIDGEVLEQIWCQALSVVPSYDELAAHLREYGVWLDKVLAKGVLSCVDAVPHNIIVDKNASWHLIDQQWQAHAEVGKEINLFRALLYFALNARDLLAELELNAVAVPTDIGEGQGEPRLIETIEDFIRWGFESTAMDYHSNRADCLAFESQMQKQIVRTAFHHDLDALLSTPIYQRSAAQSLPDVLVTMRAYWTQVEGAWHPDHSVASEVSLERGLAARLVLPDMVADHRYLRIDPGADVMHAYRGWLVFNGLSIIVQRKGGVQSTLLDIKGASELFSLAKCKGLRVLSGNRLVLSAAEAYCVLDLSTLDWGEEIDTIYLDLSFDFYLSADIAAERQLFGAETASMGNRIRHRQKILNRYQERIVQASGTLRDLEKRIAATRTEEASQNYFDRFMNKIGLKAKR